MCLKARNAFKRFDREMLNQLGNSLNALKGPRDFIFFISVAIFSDGGYLFLLFIFNSPRNALLVRLFLTRLNVLEATGRCHPFPIVFLIMI